MDELTRDRGAFFGSIMATANHLLWADTLWMNRFDPSVAPPAVEAGEHTRLHQTIGSWAADRFRLDGKIRFWADGVKAVDIMGDMSWYASTAGREFTAPITSCIMQFFNHQTHHRGQMHAMITAAGQKAPVTDVVLMPEEG